MRTFSWCLAFACLAGCHKPDAPWFRDAATEAGLSFEHHNGATGKFLMPEIMGSGCALFDYDSDGDLDALLLQGAPEPGGHRLFRNDLIPSGKLTFREVTAEAGLSHSGVGMGAAVGDINNDGRPDLLLTGFGANQLYRNEGGRFVDVTKESPDLRMSELWSSSATFFDYDHDGWQDLLILRYVDYSIAKNKHCTAPTGETDYCTPRAYSAVPAHLFHNEHGKFVDVSEKAGLTKASGPGLGVVVTDANQDGWPDLFVANDASANHLWINRKDGTFEEKAMWFGVAYGDEGLAKAGMGVAAGDYDNDGDEDLLVLNLMREGATLFQSGPGGYEDVSLPTAIHALTFAFTGFGVGWVDVDRDGYLDLFVANGAVTRREEQRGQPFPFAERNLLLLHPPVGGPKFGDGSQRGGPEFARTGVARGAAFGDIDNDGDVDILVNVNQGAARLLLNETPPRNWVSVAVAGMPSNGDVRIEVKAPGIGNQTRWIRTDGSYLSASDPRVHFGLGVAERIESVTVTAPGASPRVIRDVPVNQLLRAPR